MLGGKPLIESLLVRIGADRSLDALADDLAEINYGAEAPLTG